MRTVGMGLLFYPRGGSAQVVRYLGAALPGAEWQPHLVTGSVGDPGSATHAPTFFGRTDLATVDFTRAAARFDAGGDPMDADVPMHPSYEDRAGVPDRVFAAVEPSLADRQTRAWSEAIGPAWADAEVLHLHHLTPIHDAAFGLWPERPVITHLHGTELKMIAKVRSLEQLAGRLGDGLTALAARGGPDQRELARLDEPERVLAASVRWKQWEHGRWWVDRMSAAARRSARAFVLSDQDRKMARELLGLPDERMSVMPNGVDTERFRPTEPSGEERLSAWRRWMVDEPAGWDRSGTPGTIRYTVPDLDAFVDPETGEPAPVILYVGRFLGFKRVPLLVRAYGRARQHFRRPAPLVIWGGAPGEWEGEHPHDVAMAEGVRNVFFVGWRGHDELPMGLACSEVLAAPSVDEPFGQVYLEAMACELPVIATRTGGPLSFVNTVAGDNGWLVPPDDVDALADALVEAVNDRDERRRRGGNALGLVRAEYSWSVLARRFAAEYESVLG